MPLPRRKRLREEGQPGTADRVIALAENQARMIQEQARAFVAGSTESAMNQRVALLAEYNQRRASELGLVATITNGAANAVDWSARFLVYSALAAFLVRKWRLPPFSFAAGLALGIAAIGIGLVKAVAPVAVFDIALPMYAAAILVASRDQTLSPTALLTAGFVILYQRFGQALAIVGLILLLTATAGWLGSQAPYLATNWFELDWEAGEEVVFVSTWFGALLGLELGRAVAAAMFLSVIAESPASEPTTSAAS